MKKLRHTNIVNLIDVTRTTDYVYLILEYCDNGDLAQYLTKNEKISEAQAQFFIRQLALGLEFLRKK